MSPGEDDAAVAAGAPGNWPSWLAPPALLLLILLGSPLLAILAGAALTMAANRPVLKTASRYGKLALQTAIVLLGFNLDAHSMWQVSRDYAGIIAGYVLVTFGAGVALGRLLGVDAVLGRLMSAGTAICGGTAIATLSPILRARADQMAVALTIVFALNMLALLIFPVIGGWLGLTQAQFGVWAALAVHDTSSVVATAAVYGQPAAEVATTLKLGRTLWLIPLVLAFSMASRGNDAKIRIPGFILLFVLASIVGSIARAYAWAPASLLSAIQAASKALIVTALFFIGLECTRQTVRNLHGRVLWQALALWALVVPITLLIALRFA
jgi:uncharacterized integral membrane protein (TIGR00698 family)